MTEHKWTEPTKTVQWEHCGVCGIVRRADRKNKPECPGAIPVTLREPQQHLCTVCYRPAAQHSSACDCGCGATFGPLPLCCEGCMCESFEDAHNNTEETTT